jgi:aromatic-L-amino-acid/L-tryptophan decarboxylase
VTPDEFRAAGHALIDWIADFRATLPERPVMAQVQPGDVRAAMPSAPPSSTDGIADLLRDLDDLVLPGMTHVQHPDYFGYFPANASLSSVLGDLASSGLGGLGITWQSCPSLTEVEEVVCEWMRQLVGLSDAWVGTIHDTASTACLVALLCARERATGMSQAGGGMPAVASAPVVYASPGAHSSIRKAALLAGYGADHLRMVDVDPTTYAMRADALTSLMEADRAAGLTPAAVIASVGTTGTTAMDPVAEIVDVATTFGAWVHVDAAMAGTAMLCPELRGMWNGVEAADSVSWNPHKWMGAVLDTSLFYVRDPQHLIRVMSTDPSYLRAAMVGEQTQYRDWGIPLGRRFRSLKLWFQLRLDGIAEVQARVRRDMANAQWLAEQVGAAPGWRVLAPVALQTVCVRFEPDGVAGDDLDRLTLAWADAINASGAAYLTPSQLDGRWMVRVSIGAIPTERSHVAALWDLMQHEAAEAAKSA